MARTRTPGITIDRSDCRTLNKDHRATRIFARLGEVNQEAAEERLKDEIRRVDLDLEQQALARPLFTDCAMRYLSECRTKRSAEAIGWQVRMPSCEPSKGFKLGWRRSWDVFSSFV